MVMMMGEDEDRQGKGRKGKERSRVGGEVVLKGKEQGPTVNVLDKCPNRPWYSFNRECIAVSLSTSV